MAKVQATSTQDHIPIAGVRESIVILKDGSYRLILSVSPINFSLKSEQEQNALIFRYQSFLNSLHFPIQITMQSKKLDLTPYLQKMKQVAKDQANELIRVQTEDYIDFVGQLINVANIMSKKFFVSVSYTPLSLPKLSFVDKLLGKSHQSNVLRISDKDFKEHSQELLERGNQIAQGLGALGLRVQQLTTQDILELFYTLYNPEEAGSERLVDPKNLQSSVVVDKTEAMAAAEAHAESEEEHATIDNAPVVEAASQQTAPNPTAETTNNSTSMTNQTEATDSPTTTEEPPPIKQRLEATKTSAPTPVQNQTVATSNNNAPAPAVSEPQKSAADQPLADDNYQIR